jgi:hypothetical protein
MAETLTQHRRWHGEMLSSVLPGVSVAMSVAINEILVARHGDDRSSWGWIVPSVVPLAAARGWRARDRVTLSIGLGFALGLLLADVALSGLGWNQGKPAGWDLIDSDPIWQIVVETLALTLWAMLMASIATMPVFVRKIVSARDTMLRAAGVGALAMLCIAPTLLFTVARGTLPPARVTHVRLSSAMIQTYVDLLGATDRPTDGVRVRYFDPGTSGNLTLGLRIHGRWYSAQARLGPTSVQDVGPRERWIDVVLPAGTRADDITELRLRVWPRQADPYIEDIRIMSAATKYYRR